MDMGLTQGEPYRLLPPIARLLIEFAPGDAYSDPWSDLADHGTVESAARRLGRRPSTIEEVRRELTVIHPDWDLGGSCH
jgi:hypothetical protein